VTYLWRALSVC